jgi:hypothetical protein
MSSADRNLTWTADPATNSYTQVMLEVCPDGCSYTQWWCNVPYLVKVQDSRAVSVIISYGRCELRKVSVDGHLRGNRLSVLIALRILLIRLGGRVLLSKPGVYHSIIRLPPCPSGTQKCQRHDDEGTEDCNLGDDLFDKRF